MTEDHDGGYTDSMRVPADMVVLPIPEGMYASRPMALGTPGITTVPDRLGLNGLQPQSEPIAVTPPGHSGPGWHNAPQLHSPKRHPAHT
jgi:D-arabinose 1-dehydrogenase-like Zn-dependent alcohol dehydrogenase